MSRPPHAHETAGRPPPGFDLEVDHETRYVYEAPVTQAHHIAHLKPLADRGQQLLDFSLSVRPDPTAWRDSVDSFGNASLHFALTLPHRELVVHASSRVRTVDRFHALQADRSPGWELVRDRLRYVARAPFDRAAEFVQPSPYVPRLEQLREFGRASFLPGRPVAQAALELMQRVHDGFEYRSDSTHVDTPLAHAFEQRSGVCQDFSHVMIGACRMLGLAARYVSGYLLTHALDGEPPPVGAEASHAWVQLYAPQTPGVPDDGWLDLDPTNNRIPGAGHVRVAVGRDYGDVTPLRGVIRGGGGEHTLSVGVTTRRTSAGHAPGAVVAM